MESEKEKSGWILRSRLEKNDPLLYQSLIKSWDIALNEWLPAISHDDGSLNSFPHLRNVEKKIDEIIQAFETIDKSANTPMSSSEMYILLSAVLFHDIGRSDYRYIKEKEEKKTDRHAHYSSCIILEKYAHLGIPNYDLAKCIATVCEHHDPKLNNGDGEEELYHDKLSTIVIDPYGIIRQRFIASILILADYLDNAYARLLPRYIYPDKNISGKSLFRRFIRGIYLDPKSRHVRTVLVSRDRSEMTSREISKYSITTNPKKEDEIIKYFGIKKYNSLIKLINNANISSYSENEFNNLLIEQIYKDKNMVDVNKNISFLGKMYLGKWALNLMLTKGWLHIKPALNENCGIIFTTQTFFLLAFGNLIDNCIMVEKIRNTLASGGIYILSWQVEQDEHLYNTKLEETYEPVFDKNYLINISESMWKLSSQIFSNNHFSYRTLASFAGEPDVEKVRIAVRRIDIITTSYLIKMRKKSVYLLSGPISIGIDDWAWKMRINFNKKCDYISIYDVIEAIKLTGDPHVIR